MTLDILLNQNLFNLTHSFKLKWNAKRTKAKRCYLPKGIMKYSNVMINR